MNPIYADSGTIGLVRDLLLVNHFLLPFMIVAGMFLAASIVSGARRLVMRHRARLTTATPLRMGSTLVEWKR